MGMKINDLDTPFQELSCEEAAAIDGGAAMLLFTGKNFQGAAVKVVAKRGGQRIPLNGRFNNSISSAKVISGTWDIRSERDGTGGLGITLKPGKYPSFAKNFNDVASLAIATVA